MRFSLLYKSRSKRKKKKKERNSLEKVFEGQNSGKDKTEKIKGNGDEKEKKLCSVRRKQKAKEGE